MVGAVEQWVPAPDVAKPMSQVISRELMGRVASDPVFRQALIDELLGTQKDSSGSEGPNPSTS